MFEKQPDNVEQIAQRVAQIMRGGGSNADRPARIVEHTQLICDQNGKVVDADHENPVAAMQAMGIRNPTFSGFGSQHRMVSKIDPSHAQYLPEVHGEFPDAD